MEGSIYWDRNLFNRGEKRELGVAINFSDNQALEVGKNIWLFYCIWGGICQESCKSKPKHSHPTQTKP